MTDPNRTTPPEHDRTKCRPWCGKRYGDKNTPSRHDTMMWFNPSIDGRLARDDKSTWCSAACRDLRLPPLPVAPETPAQPKVEYVAREKGQTWSCNGGPAFTLDRLVEMPVAHEIWEDKIGGWWVGWEIAGFMTLLAPAPRPETAPAGYCGKSYPTVFGGFTCNRTDAHLNEACAWNAGRWSPVSPLAGTETPVASKPVPAPRCCKPGELHHVEVLKRTWKERFDDDTWTQHTNWLCKLHYLETEPKAGGSDILHNAKVPERLTRAKLAHSYGVEDPALEDA